MLLRRRATLRRPVEFVGVGVHGGKRVTMRVCPLHSDNGIMFNRVDVADRERIIRLSPECVTNPILRTCITNEAGVSIAVVEHLLAALRICKITDAIVEIEGDEVPIMDGSAVEFTNKFLNVGLRYRNSMVPALVIADEITVSSKSGRISVRPSKERKISVELSCERLGSLVDGRNCYSFKLDDDLNNIAESRTFGWLDDYCEIRKRGMARGASEDNTIVILSDGTVKNAGGLRHEKEIVMHKCLDLIGDLCVLECDIIGDITAINPSHALNNSFVMEIGKAFRSYSKMAARPSRQFLDRASLRGFAR